MCACFIVCDLTSLAVSDLAVSYTDAKMKMMLAMYGYFDGKMCILCPEAMPNVDKDEKPFAASFLVIVDKLTVCSSLGKHVKLAVKQNYNVFLCAYLKHSMFLC